MKICLIGAGSTIFAKNLIGDFLLHPEIVHPQIVLHDIDTQRLRTSRIVAERLLASTGASATIESTLDRRAAIQAADYVILMMQVGGYQPATVRDFAIPKKYGLRQTIADTLGIGGIMRAQRTIPVLLDICREVTELAPAAVMLNYVNPMAMLSWAVKNTFPQLKIMGLCHSVQLTIKELAEDLKISPTDIDYHCAGINHMAFYLRLAKKAGDERSPAGHDLYPHLRTIAAQKQFPPSNHVRYAVLEKWGYFVTESSEHFAEYVPWFIKSHRKDLIQHYNIPLDEYLVRCEKQLAQWQTLKQELEKSEKPLAVKRSDEYAADIIAALAGGRPTQIYANVPNTFSAQLATSPLITNLPANCIVEVPCDISKGQFVPQKIGEIPMQLAALMRTNVNVQELAVAAALTLEKNYLYHAAMLDPHTASELALDDIYALVDELLSAHAAYLPSYH